MLPIVVMTSRTRSQVEKMHVLPGVGKQKTVNTGPFGS